MTKLNSICFCNAIILNMQACHSTQAWYLHASNYLHARNGKICATYSSNDCDGKGNMLIKNLRLSQAIPQLDQQRRISSTLICLFTIETLGLYTYLQICTLDVGPEFPFMKASKYLRSTTTWDMIRESQ